MTKKRAITALTPDPLFPMQPTHKLIVMLAILTVLSGVGLWYVTLQSLPEEVPADSESGLKQVPPPVPILNIEPLPVFYLGEYIHPSKEKQAIASRLLASVSGREPNRFGIITQEQAPDEIKIILQKSSTGLANFSAFDLACMSIVDLDRPCSQIQSEYVRNHEGFLEHANLFPPSEGYTCEAIRFNAQPAIAAIKQDCSRLQDPRQLALCRNLPDSCTPSEDGAPCDLMQATVQAMLNHRSCSDFTSGQRAYLCQAIAAHDCQTAASSMVEDYAYTELALSSGEPQFCSLVEEPHLRAGCIGGDRDTVRNDLLRSYID